MKKIVLLAALLCVLLLCLFGCDVTKGKGSRKVNEKANEITEAFSRGDITEITRIVFGTTQTSTSGDEIIDLVPDNSQTPTAVQDGILQKIFSHVSVKVNNTTEDSIEYEISAPDMRDVFSGLSGEAGKTITKEQLALYISEYANSAEITKTVVSVGIAHDGDNIVVDYQNEEFINALTGGLLDAYKSLYLQMIEEYREEVR